jgi:DNA modification methylase
MTSMMMKELKLSLPSELTPQLKARDKARRAKRANLTSAPSAGGRRRNDCLPQLAIINRPIDDLKAPSRMLRKLDPAHIQEIAASIGALGFCVPVLIGEGNQVLDGLARVEAARLMSLPHVPCIQIDHLSSEEQRVLRLAINRIAEKGSWDLEELRIEFEELVLLDAPIELSGFTPDEIDQIIVCNDGLELTSLEPEAGANAIARLGDMFQLGPHRLVCGDATDVGVLQRLMMENDGSSGIAQLLWTDEPYNLKIAGHVTSGAHREFAMASGEMSNEEFRAFNMRWMEAALSHLCDGAVFGTFIDWRGYPLVHGAATALGLTPLNLVVWAKPNAGLGSLYRSQHELLPLFKKGVGPHINNVELGRRGRWRSNLWTYAGASSLGSDARRGLKDHPTVKPVQMLIDALLDLTDRGNLVLDQFLGSGSTLIAADRTGRVCRGVEIDPLYVDLIVRRYEAETGQKAMLVETGESYVDLAARRSAEERGRQHPGEGHATLPAVGGAEVNNTSS